VSAQELFMVDVLLIAIVSVAVVLVARLARDVARVQAATRAAPPPSAAPEPNDKDDSDDEKSRCLHPGQTVVCHLSDTAHTHGRIIGFAMGEGGAMFAMVDVGGGAPLMPISVDDLETDHSEGDPRGYRDNAKDLN
jgi:hypothetical protein